LPRLDECLGLRRHAFESASRPLGFCFEDREHGLGIVGVSTSQFPCNVIERGAEVVNAIADDQSPLVAGNFR
jgi:hypothetical protein